MLQSTDYWINSDINDIKDCIFKDLFKSIKVCLINELNNLQSHKIYSYKT